MSDFMLEFRSGMEWKVRYEDDMPVEGYIEDIRDGSRVAEVFQGGDGLFVGRVGGEIVTSPERWFDEAVDRTHRSIWGHEELWTRCRWHDQGGAEGIYKLGEENGKVYVANAFWSDSEPGYASFSVFEVDLAKETLDVLTSGYYNGYLSIEGCIRGEAFDRASGEPTSFEYICSCSWEIDTFEDLASALDEHDLPLAALCDMPRSEIADLKREVIDFANERTNGAFAEHMTYEKAVQCLDEPGLGLPIFIEGMVGRIEALEEAACRDQRSIEAQIAEARATSEAVADKDHEQKRMQGMEDPSL